MDRKKGKEKGESGTILLVSEYLSPSSTEEVEEKGKIH